METKQAADTAAQKTGKKLKQSIRGRLSGPRDKERKTRGSAQKENMR